MKATAKTGHNLLNALAFANVGNIGEFHQLLNQSPAVQAGKSHGQQSAEQNFDQALANNPSSLGAATTLCATQD